VERTFENRVKEKLHMWSLIDFTHQIIWKYRIKESDISGTGSVRGKDYKYVLNVLWNPDAKS
jgi:hypothetical protein